MQLINDVSVQVEVGGACLCDSTAAPPLHDIATVAITDYYNSYISSGPSIDRSVDIDAVPGYRHVRLSTREDKNQPIPLTQVGDRPGVSRLPCDRRFIRTARIVFLPKVVLFETSPVGCTGNSLWLASKTGERERTALSKWLIVAGGTEKAAFHCVRFSVECFILEKIRSFL